MEDEEQLESVKGYLKAITFPYRKEYMIQNKENWVQQLIYMTLFNRFGSVVRRESVLGDKGEHGRIDFSVYSIGIEVKIFRSMDDVRRLYHEIVHYKQHFDKIVVPYVNAGGVPTDKLLYELQLLQKEFPQIKDFFELRIAKKGEATPPVIQQQVNVVNQQTEGKGMKILRGIGSALKTIGEAASKIEVADMDFRPPSDRDMQRLIWGEPEPTRRKKKSKRKRSRSMAEEIEDWDRRVAKQLSGF